jgi:hypothetical protein
VCVRVRDNYVLWSFQQKRRRLEETEGRELDPTDAPVAAVALASVPTAATRRAAALSTSTDIVESLTYQVVQWL